MRSESWLENRFEYIYREYFSDLKAPNQIEIKWGRRSRRQLGCIKRERPKKLSDHLKKNFTTIIVVNGLFKDEKIPVFIIDAVIAHEMSHYAHGFNSPLPQIHHHPHRGGVIKKELSARDLIILEMKQKKWMKENWVKYLDVNFPSTQKTKVRYKIVWR